MEVRARDLNAYQAVKRSYGGEQAEGFKRYIERFNKDQFSPLNSAACAGHVAVVNILLETAKRVYGGINIISFKRFLEWQNKHGFTPLNAACHAITVQHKKVALLLLSYHANPDIINRRGYSARKNAPKAWALFADQSVNRSAYNTAPSHSRGSVSSMQSQAFSHHGSVDYRASKSYSNKRRYEEYDSRLKPSNDHAENDRSQKKAERNFLCDVRMASDQSYGHKRK